jgi:hypothetical protein
MKWIVGLSLLMFLVFTGPRSLQAPSFPSRYPRVESYEIRRGVLATPVYSPSGAVCQVSFEQHHVQKDAVHMQAEMSHDLVLQIINELAPPYARGNPLWQVGGYEYLDITSGNSVTSVADYENVSVQIFYNQSDTGDAAAIIKWKNACQ